MLVGVIVGVGVGVGVPVGHEIILMSSHPILSITCIMTLLTPFN